MADTDSNGSLHQYGILKNISRQRHLRNVFFTTFCAAQICGLLMVVLVVIWAINGNSVEQSTMNANGSAVGGIGPFLGFYYHPVLMTIGMLFLTGQGAMLFRVFRDVDRNILKIPHLCLMSVTVVLTVLGTYSIFVAQSDTTPMRNLHNWVGMTAIVVFGVQFVAGFLAKFFPGASPPLAQWYRPVHNCTGAIVFVLASAAVLTGLALDGEKDFSTGGSLSKVVGMLAIGYTISVVVLAMNRDFSRSDPIPLNKLDERSPLLAATVTTVSTSREYNAIE